jgi:hypothetical protein
MEACRRVLADAAGATVITLLVGFVLASLSAAGVVTMTLATIFLLLAWTVGVWLTFLIKPIVEMTLLHKCIFASVLAAGLIAVWFYELNNQAQASSGDHRTAQNNQTITAPNNSGIITQGQTGSNYLGQMPRHLTDTDKSTLLSRLPKGRSIEIHYHNQDADTVDLAKEYDLILTENGYYVTKFEGSMMLTPPRDVVIYDDDDKTNLPISIVIGIRK